MMYYLYPGYATIKGKRVMVTQSDLMACYGLDPSVEDIQVRVLFDTGGGREIRPGWHLFPIWDSHSNLALYPHVSGIHYFFKRRHAHVFLLGLGYKQVDENHYVLVDDAEWRFAKLEDQRDSVCVTGWSKMILPGG